MQDGLSLAQDNPGPELYPLMTEARDFAAARRSEAGAWFSGNGQYARHQRVTAVMAQRALSIVGGDMRIPHFTGVQDPRALREQMMHEKIVQGKAVVLRALSSRLGQGFRDALKP